MMHEIRRHDKMAPGDESPDSLKFAQLTEAAVKESQRWIEYVTGDRFEHRDNLIKSLQDGILLCRLANSLKAGCIRRINYMHTPVAYLDNLSVFQSACRNDFRLQEAQLFDIRDLDDLDIRGTLESEEEVDRETRRRLRKVLVTLYWLGRAARTSRPDGVLDLRAFEGLVDPSYFDMTSSADPVISCPGPTSDPLGSARVGIEDKNNSAGKSLEGRLDWELKFRDWKDREKSNGTAPEGGDEFREHGKVQGFGTDGVCRMPNPSEVSGKEIREEDYEDKDEAPLPPSPNWNTFPAGRAYDPCDVDFFEDAEGTPRFSHTSSSSSASSFATKDFGSGRARTVAAFHPNGAFRPVLSPTSALLSVSPETLNPDQMSGNFEGLLKDMERFSNVSKSQSLDCLEDFDEVGYEEASEEGDGVSLQKEKAGDLEASGARLVRKPSDFMEELTSLEEATRKYDHTCLDSPDFHFDKMTPEGDARTLVVLQSPELLEKPRPLSAKLTDILRQNSFGSHCSQPSRPASSRSMIQSTMMDRFVHDLETVLKVGQSPVATRKALDLEQERKRMEEWGRKAEEKLKSKFERDQDALKEKLNEDMRKAHQVERMKQLEEEKFLEEEIIEVKNRRSLAAEGTGAKFSKSSLTLFNRLYPKSVLLLAKSPGLPSSYGSLTDDWLSQNQFHSDAEKSSFDTSLQRSEDLTFPADEEEEEEEDKSNREVFEEPAWMRIVTEKVDKVVGLDAPVNTATMELLPDSLTASSESVHSSSNFHSKEDIREEGDFVSTAEKRGENDSQQHGSILTEASSSSGGVPPIPERGDSLLVTGDILVSREQAAYLTFDSSISNFAKNHPLPPSSLRLVPNGNRPEATLLTPSSDRCSEVCTYVPPSPIVPYKKPTQSKESPSSVFPSPKSPERSDYLLSTTSEDSGSKPVDYLFAYHDDQQKRRYYWATSARPSSCVSPVELASQAKQEEKASCSGCGYCLASEQTIDIFALKSRYHPGCFKCLACDAPLGSDNVAIYQSEPHCLRCFEDLCRHSR